MSRPQDAQKSWAATRWARSALRWCQDHPLPAVVAVAVGSIIAAITFVQGIDWVWSKLTTPEPKILDIDSRSGAGGNYAVTVENPTDMTIIVTGAVFRAEPPPAEVYAHFNELRIPALTYDVPFDCSPGTKRITLNPPFRVTAKNVGAVVFRSTVPMRECQLYISLKTTRGQTAEQEAFSAAAWRERAP